MRARIVVLLAALSAGCASLSNVQTADTLGRGGVQVGIEPGVLGATTSSSNVGSNAYIPHVDVSARFGVSPGVDVGFRAGLSFLELQGKFLFTRPGARPLVVSFAPTIGGLVLPANFLSDNPQGFALLNIGLPVLIGYKFKGGSELILGPRLQNLVVLASAQGSATQGYGLGVGASVGFALRFGDHFALLPEAAVVAPVYGGAAFSTQFSSGPLNSGLFLFQFKLGVLLGKFRSVEEPPPAYPVQAPPRQPQYAPQRFEPSPYAPAPPPPPTGPPPPPLPPPSP